MPKYRSLPKKYDGKVKHLPESVTTMWEEKTLRCPNYASHKITGSSDKVYCYDCGIWWKR